MRPPRIRAPAGPSRATCALPLAVKSTATSRVLLAERVRDTNAHANKPGHQPRQIDLADLTSIEVSTLSRLVTRLVRMGIVSRTRSASSTREVAVKLTAKGKAQVARLAPLARDYEAAAIAGVRPDELATVKSALRRMYANMKARQPASAAGATPRARGRRRAPLAAE